jgi:RNA polymerase sigma factor (sigma-70 family)
MLYSKNNIIISIVNILINNESMKVGDIIKETKLIHTDIKDQYIYNIVRNNKDLFICIKNGYYAIKDKFFAIEYCKSNKRHIKNRIPINGLSVKNNSPILHIDSEEKELNIEKHIAFIKQISIRAAKLFKLDVQDIFNEAILLAYQYKDRYNYKTGNPTTFLNSQITPRLYNKIKREILPNYFKTIKNNDGSKSKCRFLVSEESLYRPIDNNDYGNTGLLIDYIDPIDTLDELGYNSNETNTSYLTESNDFKISIMEAFKESELNDKEILCIRKKFGLGENEDTKTLEEIAIEINKTKEGVRQIIKRGCKKLERNQKLIDLNRYID